MNTFFYNCVILIASLGKITCPKASRIYPHASAESLPAPREDLLNAVQAWALENQRINFQVKLIITNELLTISHKLNDKDQKQNKF